MRRLRGFWAAFSVLILALAVNGIGCGLVVQHLAGNSVAGYIAGAFSFLFPLWVVAADEQKDRA